MQVSHGLEKGAVIKTVNHVVNFHVDLFSGSGDCIGDRNEANQSNDTKWDPVPLTKT